MTFDSKDFRRALSQFPTGVTVITTRDPEGNYVGMTASSFNSVSLTPPLVAWGIDKGALSAEVFKNTSHFAINVLTSEQMALSNRFASRGEDKFSGVKVSDGVGGCPLLSDCAAYFQCKTWAVYDGGDHHILVGEVVKYDYSPHTSALVFHKGRYAVSNSHPQLAQSAEVVPASGFVGDFLLYLLRRLYGKYSGSFYPHLSEHGVTAEEWRVLTVLSEQPLVVDAIAPLVSQPKNEVQDTIDWLAQRALVSRQDEVVDLTATGRELVAKLVAMAVTHEQNVLREFSDEQVRDLKSTLKAIMDKLPA